MKRIMLMLIIGVSLFGVNVFAAGDLIVNGKLGVGTATPGSKVEISTANEKRALKVDNELNQGVPEDFIMGAAYIATLTGSASGSVYGFSGILKLMTTAATARSLYGASFIAQIGNPDTAGTTDVTRVVGLSYALNRHYANTRTYNVANSYGFLSSIQQGGPDGTAINVANHYHQYLDDKGILPKVNITNLYGMYIEKMTGGSNNYGIVLDGDGAGAEISFGFYDDATNSGRPQIYSQDGFLYARDYLGNQTLTSPHDPETGEWIFYSKNIKTGRVVRVNMEQLVKAVEKLTGETFMVETLIEDK